MAIDFTTPVWYNVSSFDGETEKWWYVTVQQEPVSAGVKALQEIKIYPNPASGWVQIQLPANICFPLTIELMNMQGVVGTRYLIDNPNGAISLDISRLTTGLYLCRTIAGNLKLSAKLNKF